MKTSIISLLFALLLAVFTPFVQAQTAPPTDVTLELFLLVGQSNMAGRGKVEPRDQIPHPRVWMLDSTDQWAPAIDPLHFDKPKVAGVSLGSTFGRTIAEAEPSSHVGLIPCAVGGTSIDQWRKGGELYENGVRRARLAMQRGTLAGILWHQGESDTAEPKRAAYAKKLVQLVADLRKDLEAPGVPFVLGQLGPFREAKVSGNDAMNELLASIPESVPNSACVTSEKLTDLGDQTHFDAASLRELGRRYAGAYLKLVEKAAPDTRAAAAGPSTNETGSAKPQAN